jgi:hypothetical protein
MIAITTSSSNSEKPLLRSRILFRRCQMFRRADRKFLHDQKNLAESTVRGKSLVTPLVFPA